MSGNCLDSDSLRLLLEVLRSTTSETEDTKVRASQICLSPPFKSRCVLECLKDTLLVAELSVDMFLVI